jgi:hypothetical protein
MENKNCCEVGTHKCAININVPEDIEIWNVCRDKKKKIVSVDKCLKPAILALWKAGIPTVNSCCGHGVEAPSIIIEPQYIGKIAIKKERSTPLTFRENVIKRIPLVVKCENKR